MKTIILAATIALGHSAHALDIREQINCRLPTSGLAKELHIESGAYDHDVNDPGTLTLVGADGSVEKVTPTAGVGGIFNEHHFPNYFRYENDAQKPQRLKFQTRQLGQVYISYICHRPNALFCEDRGGDLMTKAIVAININGTEILNFNDKSLPFCERRVIK